MKGTIKMSDEKRKKEKLMELNQEKKVANHLDLIAKISVFFQPTAGIIAILIMILRGIIRSCVLRVEKQECSS
ncbi:MAG: hypothetical protein K1060chlam4_00783 [Candidatus Anoxychlamydiales bacterium]|nr:hypothetical protein [Candidatus Anoxychlamydiales bacterium]